MEQNAKVKLVSQERIDAAHNKTGTGKSARAELVRLSPLLMRKDLKVFLDAINEAEIDGHWNRDQLLKVYKKVMYDPNLTSQWNTRKIKTLSRDFFLKDKDGGVMEDATMELKKPWFYRFLSLAMDSKAYGFSLIELTNWNEERRAFMPYKGSDGRMYDDVTDFPREYVKPEIGHIVKQPNDAKGFSYTSGRFSDQLIFIGETHNFGFLVDVAAMVLIKDRTIANWGEFAEVFGQDLLVAYSDSTGDARIKLKAALQGLGSSGRMIADPETDKVETVGSTRRDAHDVFKELIITIDGQVDKRIFGQNVVSNNTGQVVGKTGENVSNLYGEDDARWLAYIINDVLFPFMADRNISMVGRFWWDTTEKLSLKEKHEKDIAVTKMGFWLSEEYIKRTYGVDGVPVAPYFNRVQTEEGEHEPTQPTSTPPKAVMRWIKKNLKI